MRIASLALIIMSVVLHTGCATQTGSTRFRLSALDVDLRTPEQLQAAKPEQPAQVQSLPSSIWASVVNAVLSIKGRVRFGVIEFDQGPGVLRNDPDSVDPDYTGHRVTVPAPTPPSDDDAGPPAWAMQATGIRNGGPIVARSIATDPQADPALRARMCAPLDPPPSMPKP